MNECIFCKIVAGDVPADIVYDDNDTLAFLDINPINPGHILVIPKEHHEHMFETPNALLEKLITVSKLVGNAAWQAVDADGMNLGCNTKDAGGQEIPHTHFHVMPRFIDDGHTMWHGKPYESEEQKKAIVKKIQENI